MHLFLTDCTAIRIPIAFRFEDICTTIFITSVSLTTFLSSAVVAVAPTFHTPDHHIIRVLKVSAASGFEGTD